MTVMLQPDEKKNTIIQLRNLNNSGTADKNSFPLLSSPLCGSYAEQRSADNGSRTLLVAHALCFGEFSVSMWTGEPNWMKRTRRLLLCIREVPGAIIKLQNAYPECFRGFPQSVQKSGQLNEAMPDAIEILAIHPLIRLFDVNQYDQESEVKKTTLTFNFFVKTPIFRT